MSADDGIRIEHVSFYSEACRLDGELYLPADLKPDSKVPGMVLITGYMGTRDMYLPGMAAEITKSGRYVSLIFDFKGELACQDAWERTAEASFAQLPCFILRNQHFLPFPRSLISHT